MARRVTSPVLVGRTDAVEQLVAAVAAARTGQPRHVLVGGEAGVGKTRLLARVRELAQAEGARVLSGACVWLGEAGLPLAPYTGVLRSYVARDGAPQLAALAGPAAADLARLLPALGREETPPVGEPWAQTRLYEALLGLFGRLAARAPLVLWLEDLHWAGNRRTARGRDPRQEHEVDGLAGVTPTLSSRTRTAETPRRSPVARRASR